MCATAQCHEASLRTCAHTTKQNCCVRTSLCSREETRLKFNLLSEVIFKDLAVPSCNCNANVRKLVSPSCGHDTGIRRQVT